MNRPPQPSPQRPATRRKRRMGFVVVLVVVLVSAFLLAAPSLAVAQDNDVGAPTLEGGERVNDSAMQVTVADDRGVNESSITAADFDLSAGEIASLETSQVGSNALVTLSLTDRIDVNDVTVSIGADGNITDVTGNALRDGSVTVTGMDSFDPELVAFESERVNDTTVQVTVETDKPLSALQLQIDGPTSTERNLSHFEEVPGQSGNVYATTYTFPEDGTYLVGLESMTDTSELQVNRTERHAFVRDTEPPTAVLEGPRVVKTDDRTSFTAERSTDNVGIDRYEWVLDGDGVAGSDQAANGDTAENDTTFEHTFTEPGTHTISLTVVDGQQNNDTVTQTVRVTDAPSKQGVEVTPVNESSVEATVSADRPAERVRIADETGQLLATEAVELRSLTANLSNNDTVAVNVTANDSAPSFVETTGHHDLAAFTIDRGNQSVDSPTFRFAVSPGALSRAGLSFADIALYRDDGNWTKLDTEIVRASHSAVVYEADAPGFSTFVVGGPSTRSEFAADVPDGESTIEVTSASLHRETVAFGDLAVVAATVENEGPVTDTSTIAVSVGSETMTSRAVTVPAGESRSLEFSVGAVESGTVAVNGTVAGELTVTDETDLSENASAGDGGTPTEEGGAENGDDDGGIPIPNPLALWPGGLVGTILVAVVGITAGTYGLLKILAIYLGY